ncbi:MULTISPECIES: FAD-binding oxidoreductase [unclassified Streptomyces]|uniref:NAD(P)/FAD-dependent oxidoreductase n=1 Tax=unclassified Streptomyces TaxID=2593676 RepID=UPI001BE66231|nr:MULTISPECIES: FAD-dependent oxidoreductase [unclassified Streptomyces]MBT2406341.1 FAD-binding oxidoreductase [Streptomyces sp. ISL-21]MBT2607563.1 FAD-binding oxidoreductase [Streptomyces sp. ISL-87]
MAESPAPRADVVVIGAGVLGAAVFHELADRGASVLLVERDRGGLGTTAWSGGIVRCYHDDPAQLERAVIGWQYFREFGARTGIDVPFVESGFLYVPHPSRLEHARALVEGAAEDNSKGTAEAPMEWLSSAEADRRFGHLLNRSVDGAVWEPRAGYLDPLDVTRAYLAAGRRKGGRVLEGVEAHGVLRAGGRLRGVNTGIGAISADTVVLATGAATPGLLDSWGIGHDLWAQAIQVELRLPDGPVDGHPAYMDDEYDINGRPDPESSGMLLGHPTGQRVEGRTGGLPADPGQVRRAVAAGSARFRWAAGSAPLGSLRAAECYAPDSLARVARVPGETGLLLATGFNGGGFKMAPWAAGEIARLVAGE